MVHGAAYNARQGREQIKKQVVAMEVSGGRQWLQCGWRALGSSAQLSSAQEAKQSKAHRARGGGAVRSFVRSFVRSHDYPVVSLGCGVCMFTYAVGRSRFPHSLLVPLSLLLPRASLPSRLFFFFFSLLLLSSLSSSLSLSLSLSLALSFSLF